MGQRILVLSAAFGCGHVQAARAIAEACRAQDPDCEATALDGETWGLQRVASSYLSLLRLAPTLYQRLYHAPVGRHTRGLLRTTLCAGITRAIIRFEPTLVVATHPFPGAVASHLRRTGRLRAPLAVAVTDFMPHPFWVESGVDCYFVPTPDAAARLIGLGVPPDRVRVSGMPVRPEFGPATPHTTLLRDSTKRVLVMGGGLGLGPIIEAVRSLAVLPHPNLHVAIVCGANQGLQAELTDLFGDDRRFTIIGYTNRIPQLMARADLLVTKPGGMTASEALASHLPSLLLPPLPGQEAENAAYLSRVGAALPVAEAGVGTTAATLLFTSPERLVRMREAARLAGRPDGARLIASELLRLPQHQSAPAATHERLPSMAIG
jgi:processive 1,2-diacylglycerol beta-glucosyltransferase